MHAERDELVKRIFPQLRALCEERGGVWSDVDLRWGITNEQKAEGRVLPICLSEIERSRPFFIGLLGERYGWVPPDLPALAVQAEPWLREQVDRSITELEILHGVLNNPAMANHAFFYFRSPEFIEGLDDSARDDFLEVPSADDIARLGRRAAKRHSAEQRSRLERLKARIRHSGLPVRENYRDPRQLGELVLEDLTAAIESRLPHATIPDELDRDAAEHGAFAQSRTSVYSGREEYLAALDAHAGEDGPPLVVIGPSGSGKSALLANWAMTYQSQHPDDFVLTHFVSATRYSAEWVPLLRRVVGEVKRHYQLPDAVPAGPEGLRRVLPEMLNAINVEQGRLVLILDGLDRIEDRDGAPDLPWLQHAFPARVSVILSTAPGRPLDEVRRRAWRVLEIEPLGPQERRELIVAYLARFTKTLSSDQLDRIAKAPASGSPLFLIAVLEALRVFGVHERLDERIDYLTSAETVKSLYDRILEQHEEDYDRDRPRMVRDSLCLIWGARRGLSESELLDLLGTDEPMPRAYWAPLFYTMEQSFVNRAGLIGFGHDDLRDAVAKRYLDDELNQRDVHNTLGRYFKRRPGFPRREAGSEPDVSSFDRRKLDEQAWQFHRAEAPQELRDTLVDIPLLAVATNLGHFEEVMLYWRSLEGIYPPEEYYPPAIDAFRRSHAGEFLAEGLNAVGHVLFESQALEPAVELLAEALEVLKTEDAYFSLLTAASYSNLANLYLALERFEDAEAALLTAREITDYVAPRSLISARELNNLTALYLCMGQFDKAETFNQAAFAVIAAQTEASEDDTGDASPEIRAALAERDALLDGERWQALCKRAELLDRRGDRRGAQDAYLGALSAGARTHTVSPAQLAGTYYALALFHSRGREFAECNADLEQAREHLRRAREKAAPDPPHEAMVEAQWIAMQLELERQDAALRQVPELIARLEDVHALPGHPLFFLLDALVSELRELGAQSPADEIARGVIGLRVRAVGRVDPELREVTRDPMARDLILSNLELQELVGTRPDNRSARVQPRSVEQSSDASRGGVSTLSPLSDTSDVDADAPTHAPTADELDELESVHRRRGSLDQLATDLRNRSTVLQARNNLEGALRLLEREERLRHSLGAPADLSACLGELASVRRQMGDFDRALSALEEQEQLCRQIDAPDRLTRAMQGQVGVLKLQLASIHSLAAALAGGYLDPDADEDAIPETAAEIEERKGEFARLSEDFGERGDLELGAETLRKLERVYRELNNKRGLDVCLRYQLVILVALGRDLRGQAMTDWFAEQEQILRELGEERVLMVTIANKSMHEGFMLEELGDLDGPKPLYQRAEQIYRELGDEEALKFSLKAQYELSRAQMRATES